MQRAELTAQQQEKNRQKPQVPHGIRVTVFRNKSFGEDICSVFEAHLHGFLRFEDLPQIQIPISSKSHGLEKEYDDYGMAETISHVEDSLKCISDYFWPLVPTNSLQSQTCVKVMSVHLNTTTE